MSKPFWPPFLCLGAIFLSLALADSARAADLRWTSFGPGGGTVLSLAVDPGDPSTVYATAGVLDGESGTIYRSADRGQTWRALAGPGLSFVTLDPEHSSTIYAGGLRLLRSTDRGETWSDISPPTDQMLELTALAAAPGNVLFAGDGGSGGGRLLRSGDGGQTWSLVAQDLNEIRAIVIDPADPDRIYHFSSEIVFKSTDGGRSWPEMSRPVASPTVTAGALAVAPSAPRTLYAMLFEDPRIFRSDDGATTWRLAGTLPRSPSIFQTLAVDPRSPDRLYVGSWAGLFASADGGATWSELGAGLPRPSHQPLPFLALALAPSQPDVLYAGAADWGVAWSGSAGAHWRIGVEPGLNGGSIQFLRFNPLRPDTVYVGLGLEDPGARSFRSTDGGHTWQPFARGISQDGLYDIAFDPTAPDTLYASSASGIQKSRDGGATWTVISGQAFEQLAVLGPENLIGADCGASRSLDGGRTWKTVIGCTEKEGVIRRVRSLWTDARTPGPFYALFVTVSEIGFGKFEAFRSWDGGARWTRLPFPGTLNLLAVAPSRPKVVYTFDFLNTLYRSTDAGESWRLVHAPLPLNTQLSGGLSVDATDADTIYVGTLQGVLASHDGGKTLEPAGASFEADKQVATRLWTVPTRPGRVYAAAKDGGLFVGQFE